MFEVNRLNTLKKKCMCVLFYINCVMNFRVQNTGLEKKNGEKGK